MRKGLVAPLRGREGAKTKLGFVFLPAGVEFAGLQGGLNPRRKGITGRWFRRGFWGQVERAGWAGWLKLREEVSAGDDAGEQQVERSGGGGRGWERSLNLLRAGTGRRWGGWAKGRHTDGARTAKAGGLTKTHVLISGFSGWAVRPESICGRGLSRVQPSRYPSLGAGRCENETRFRFFARQRWVCGVSG